MGHDIDIKYWNKNYLIRYYPNSRDRSNHELIGISRFIDIMSGDEKLMHKMLSRADNNTDVTTRIRLRRGVEFVFRYR